MEWYPKMYWNPKGINKKYFSEGKKEKINALYSFAE